MLPPTSFSEPASARRAANFVKRSHRWSSGGSILALAALVLSQFPGKALAQQFWKIDGTGGTWTSLNWGNAAGGPFTVTYIPNTDAVFNANSTITYVTTTNIGNISVNAGTTTVTAAGTLTTGGNVRTINVATGASLVWTGQGVSTAAGTGFIKDGGGIWNMGASGSLYGGGFTLNDGTVIITGNNVFGNGLLTINGGTIQSTGAKNFASSGIDIGGDFSITGTGGWTIDEAVNLGNALRTITMTATGTKTWSGIVSGAGGGLGFEGTGTHVFTNAGNTFSGAIVVNGGEVEFQSNGSLGTGNSITIDGGRLALRGSFAVDPTKNIFVGDGAGTSISTPGGGSVITYNGVIADKPGEVGSWAKQGDGRLELGGANTFTGSVTLNSGELRLNNVNALATASSVIVNSGTTLQLNVTGTNNWPLGVGNIILNNGGTLRQISGADTDIAIIGQTIELTGTGGTLNAPGDSRIYVEGDISGPGALNKAGGGELRFSETAKTYTGATNINNGRLRIDNDGIPINTSAINLNSGTLRFGQASQQTYSLGAGGSAPITVTADGNIEYTDVTGAVLTNNVTIGAGGGNFRSRIAGSIFEFQGNLAGNGPLTINEGTGGNPVQAGTVFLSGDASAFTGNVSALQGTLRLSDTTVLGANTFNLSPGATLALDIASLGQFGSVSATNAVLGNGSIIAPQFSGGIAPGANIFNIITTTETVTDNGVTAQNTPLATYTFNNTGSILQLIATVNYAGAGLGLNPIQTAVGNYLGTATGGTALDAVRAAAVNQATPGAVAAFYESVAAEEVGGMLDSALFQAQDQLRSITRFAPHIQNRLALRDTLGVTTISGRSLEQDWNLFSDYKVHRGNRLRDFNMGGYDASAQTFIVGADRQFSDQFAAGYFGSYEHGRTSFDAGRGWADSDTLAIGAMGSWLFPRGHITAGIQHLHHSFDLERYSSLGTARSSPDGDQLGLILQGATQLGQGRLSITPSAHLQYHHLWLDGFTETGSAIAQTFDDIRADTLQAGVGLRIGYTIPGRTFSLRPEVFAEYRHELLDGSHAINSNLIGATGGLNIVTPERSNGYAVLGGGLHAAFSDSTSAFLQYEAQLIDSDTTTHGLYGGFRWDFSDNLLRDSGLVFSDSPQNYRDTLRGSPLGDAIDAINLRALIMLQYDNAQTKAMPGTNADPDDPADTDFWFARRIRLSADRDLGRGFNVGAAFQFNEELVSSTSSVDLFEANVGWDLFEPFTLQFGLDKVPLGWEETTGSARLKTIERSVATRAFGRLGGDQEPLARNRQGALS